MTRLGDEQQASHETVERASAAPVGRNHQDRRGGEQCDSRMTDARERALRLAQKAMKESKVGPVMDRKSVTIVEK
jgi:hypothetical protein